MSNFDPYAEPTAQTPTTNDEAEACVAFQALCKRALEHARRNRPNVSMGALAQMTSVAPCLLETFATPGNSLVWAYGASGDYRGSAKVEGALIEGHWLFVLEGPDVRDESDARAMAARILQDCGRLQRAYDLEREQGGTPRVEHDLGFDVDAYWRGDKYDPEE